MSNYIPVLILMGIGATIAGVVLVITHLLGPKNPNIKKMNVYECGVPPIGDARRRVSVKFYLVAILFLLFDVEGVFFFPWAVAYKKFLEINAFILFEMFFFIAILLVGYVYILKKGALEWD
ncbi:MAG: NADH-quinone oxidoreductase subunit A [Bdellovibrionota bacterium]